MTKLDFFCVHVVIFNTHHKQHKEALNLMTKVVTEWFTNVIELFQGNCISNTSYISFISVRWFSGCSAKMHPWTGGSIWPLGISSVFDNKTVISKVTRGGFKISMRFKLLFFLFFFCFNWAFLFFQLSYICTVIRFYSGHFHDSLSFLLYEKTCTISWRVLTKWI